MNIKTPTIHNGYLPGCIGRISHLHAAFYAPHAGFGVQFEAKVATQLSAFCLDYACERDGLWLATRDGEIEGAIAIDGSKADEHGAHLRWFIVSPALRGTGAGKQLLHTALAFCKARNYSRVYLWTFEGLDAARHLYESFGFTLVQEQLGRQWGTEVNEQRFELCLS
ncbi:MAG: GNAT family N-acetyltransferase [Pseudomonadota bacterium]